MEKSEFLVKKTCGGSRLLVPLGKFTRDMGQYLKTSATHSREELDFDSGEIVENRMEFKYLAGDPGDFVLVYTELLNVIQRWKLSYAAIVMLTYLLENYADSTIFSITKAVRKDVSERSGMSETTFYNVTRELLSHKLIVEVSHRSYRLNARYAFKGSSASQKKAMFELLQIDKSC